MKILLTGSTGFIGSAFTRLAVAQGHLVAGMALPGERLPLGLENHPQIIWLRGTLKDAPWAQIESFQPDACIHTAWITTPGVYLESPDNYKFLEASREFLARAAGAGARHLVTLGTCIEYRIADSPLSEEVTAVEPTTTYARCKNELRLWLQAQAPSMGASYCWARVFYPYGPGEHPSRLCSSIIHQLSRNEAITLKTPGSTKDYIFISDLAEAILAVTASQHRGCINLGTGIGISVREIASTLQDLLGKAGLVHEANPSSQDALGYVVADATRLRSLGWKPRHTLRDGLTKLIAAIKP